MSEFLSGPWPWYVAGPLIGLVVPAVYFYAGRKWGVSSSLRDVCAATAPADLEYFRYDWRAEGGWRLAMVAGLVAGGALAAWLGAPDVAISAATIADLAALGVTDFSGLVPSEIISWRGLTTVPGVVAIVLGGFLVGFGARYADGCTSGHAISGLASGQARSLAAVVGVFAGGLAATWLVWPLLTGGRP